MYTPHCVCYPSSTSGGHLHYLHVSDIVNNTAMDRSVHVSLQGLPFSHLRYVHEVQNASSTCLTSAQSATVTLRGAVALPYLKHV